MAGCVRSLELTAGHSYKSNGVMGAADNLITHTNYMYNRSDYLIKRGISGYNDKK